MLEVYVSTAQKEIATRYNGQRDVVGNFHKTEDGICIQCICGETHENKESELLSNTPFLGIFANIKEVRDLVKYSCGHLRRVEPVETEQESE